MQLSTSDRCVSADQYSVRIMNHLRQCFYGISSALSVALLCLTIFGVNFVILLSLVYICEVCEPSRMCFTYTTIDIPKQCEMATINIAEC